MSQDFTVILGPPRESDIISSDGQGYRIVSREHGDLVFGPIPARDFQGLADLWKRKGLEVWDLQIASALDATLCATSPEGSKLWRGEVTAGAARIAKNLKAEPSEEVAWAFGLDTGTSSLTILHTLGSCRYARQRVESALWQRGRAFLGRVPSDPDDLGRCIRLLDIFPAWRERLGEFAAKYPAWAPLVSHWSELEALYREELPEHAGRAPRLLARMRGLMEGLTTQAGAEEEDSRED